MALLSRRLVIGSIVANSIASAGTASAFVVVDADGGLTSYDRVSDAGLTIYTPPASDSGLPVVVEPAPSTASMAAVTGPQPPWTPNNQGGAEPAQQFSNENQYTSGGQTFGQQPYGAPLTMPAGGRVMTHPAIVTIAWGFDSSSDPLSWKWLADTSQMYADITTDPSVMGAFAEYDAWSLTQWGQPGTGTGDAWDTVFAPAVSSPVMGGYVIHPSNTSHSLVGNDVAYEILNDIQAGILPYNQAFEWDYVVYIPWTTHLPGSCQGWIGYHQWVSDGAVPGIALSVLPICQGTYPDGTPGVVESESWFELPATHELFETLTDPTFNGYWVRSSGPLLGYEIGDICNNQGTTWHRNGHTWSVTQLFSNRAWLANTSTPGSWRGCVTFADESCGTGSCESPLAYCSQPRLSAAPVCGTAMDTCGYPIQRTANGTGWTYIVNPACVPAPVASTPTVPALPRGAVVGLAGLFGLVGIALARRRAPLL
jgi:hypothetical protein